MKWHGGLVIQICLFSKLRLKVSANVDQVFITDYNCKILGSIKIIVNWSMRPCVTQARKNH